MDFAVHVDMCMGDALLWKRLSSGRLPAVRNQLANGGRCGCSGMNRVERSETEGTKTGKSGTALALRMTGIPETD
jgi:hypothetical protein